MFNVIKGEFIKKEEKPFVIKNNIEQELKEEIIKKDEAENEIEDLERLLDAKQDELNHIEEQIKERIEEANEEVELILEESQGKIDYEMQVAQNRGYQDGYQQGEIKAKEDIVEEFKEFVLSAKNIVDEALELKAKTIKANEEEILKFSIEIAKKIIKKESILDEQIVYLNLKNALKKLPVSKKLTIIVNWEDFSYIKELREEILNQINGVEKVDIIEDRTMQKGGCILETSMGTIDASINSQLENVFERLSKVKQESQEEHSVDSEMEV